MAIEGYMVYVTFNPSQLYLFHNIVIKSLSEYNLPFLAAMKKLKKRSPNLLGLFVVTFNAQGFGLVFW